MKTQAQLFEKHLKLKKIKEIFNFSNEIDDFIIMNFPLLLIVGIIFSCIIMSLLGKITFISINDLREKCHQRNGVLIKTEELSSSNNSYICISRDIIINE